MGFRARSIKSKEYQKRLNPFLGKAIEITIFPLFSYAGHDGLRCQTAPLCRHNQVKSIVWEYLFFYLFCVYLLNVKG